MKSRMALVGLWMFSGCSSSGPSSPTATANTPDSAMPDAATAIISGKVRLIHTRNTANTAMFDIAAGARFQQMMHDDPPIAVLGDCKLYGPVTHKDAPEPIDAGVITAFGGRQELHFTQLSNGTYTVDLKPAAIFSPGQVLHIQSPGGLDIPAFASAEIKAPKQVVILSPDTSTTPLIDRKAPFSVAWEGSTDTEFHLEIKVGGQSLACTANDADGKFTFPAEALSRLPAGAGYLLFNRFVDAKVVVGSTADFLFEATELKFTAATVR